jgi:ribose 5-phosphate isomerase RpiB
MALSKSTLSALIKSKIEAKKGTADDQQQLIDFCDAIADAVVSHVTAAAVVTSTGIVTSGTGAGGAVTATGTVS